MPEVIYTYEEFCRARQLVSGGTALFWIIEYHVDDPNSAERYNLMRNECLNHPTDFAQRLDNKQYRVWTTIPREEYSWN